MNVCQESDSNIGSVMSWSVRFLLLSTLLNALWSHSAHTKPIAFWPLFKCLHCVACCKFSLCHGTDSGLELKVDISMNLHFTSFRKKSLHKNKGHLCLVSYYTKHRNKQHAFLSSPTVCTWTHLPQHPDNKPALPWNTNIIMRLKP